MINIIIIDDDLIVLDVLSEAVNWSNLGYKLAGVFSRSCDALDFLQNNHTDVILTDIRMPKPDGIEIIEHCYTHYPNIKFIICSAYRDFSYAQAALRYGNTIDYLTKPLDFSLLEKSLKRLSEDYAALHNHFNSFDDTGRRIHFFSNLLFGTVPSNDADLNAMFEGIGIPYREYKYSLINFHINDFLSYIHNKWKHDSTSFYYAISKLIPFKTDKAYFSLARYSFENLEIIAVHKTDDTDAVINSFCLDFSNDVKNIFSIEIKKTKHFTYKCLQDILHSSEDKLKPDISEYSEANGLIASALRYIEDNCSSKLSLDEVSGHFFMSPQYFSVYFKRFTNKKFIDFLTEVRIKKACELLKTTGLSTANICHEVGYSHLGHFYDIFRKYTGMTPAEYKKNFKSSNP